MLHFAFAFFSVEYPVAICTEDVAQVSFRTNIFGFIPSVTPSTIGPDFDPRLYVVKVQRPGIRKSTLHTTQFHLDTISFFLTLLTPLPCLGVDPLLILLLVCPLVSPYPLRMGLLPGTNRRKFFLFSSHTENLEKL